MTNEQAKVISLPSADDIEEEAAQWFARLRTDGIRQDEIVAFETWRAASDRHARAYEEIEACWIELEALEGLDDIGRSVLALGPEKSTWYRRRSVLGIAATFAAVLIGGTAFMTNLSSVPSHHEQIATAIGEQKTLSLPDGSAIQLNTNGALAVEYTRDARLVRLSKGEAHFTVAHDPRRPFTVLAEDSSVTAVGTAFTVRVRQDASLEVVVTEGRVALAPTNQATISDASGAQASSDTVAELTKGQIALFQETIEDITHVSEAELNRKLSWRQGMLAYAGEPLRDVIADVSRYTPIDIEIAEQALNDIRIQGYFKVGETEALFEILELTFGIRVERVDEKHVRLLAST